MSTSLPDFTLVREGLRRRLREALEDVPGTVEIQVVEGRYGTTTAHLTRHEHPSAKSSEKDQEHGLLVTVKVTDIRGVPEERWVRCAPWIPLDGLSGEDVHRALDECVTETARAIHQMVDVITPTQEESIS